LSDAIDLEMPLMLARKSAIYGIAHVTTKIPRGAGGG
jgi:hypothetical protein